MTFPLLINLHGGGFCLYSAALDHQFCRDLALTHNLAVMNVEYRLAPEHPFPIPVDDCYAALKWATNHASQLGADVSKGLLLCGGSAGANLAAALAIAARDDDTIRQKPTGQVLIIPEVYSKSLHPLMQYQSFLQSMDKLSPGDPALETGFIMMYTEKYDGAATKADLMKPNRSPLLAHSLAGLPPAVVMVSGKDPLRDEGILYAHLLAKANGADKIKLHIYPSARHGFHYYPQETTTGKKFYKDLDEGVNWLLSHSNHSEAPLGSTAAQEVSTRSSL